MTNPNTVRCTAAAFCVTAVWLAAASVAGAQTIVKWVDAQGQTHYSDHAPVGQETETVAVHVSRPRYAPVTTSTAVPIRKAIVAAQTGGNDANARAAEEAQRQAERSAAEQERKEQADEDLVARCNQAHEIYCNQGADTIRDRETTRAQMQYADAIAGRQDRISRGLRPGVLPQPPQ